MEATIEIIDVGMDKYAWYLAAGKTPFESMYKLLANLHSINLICENLFTLCHNTLYIDFY